MRIAVLALQGAFIEHEKMLSKIGVESFEIRQLKDLEQHFDGLIIPGGESTVQGKLLRELGLLEPIRKKIGAGLILLSKKIKDSTEKHIATMDITAIRNAYGRQSGSFFTEADFKGIGKIPMTFIRAPFIEKVSAGVEVLAEVDGKIVAARQGNQLVTAFHPELLNDERVHRYFYKQCMASGR